MPNFALTTFALLSVLLLSACSGERQLDAYEQLERPPQVPNMQPAIEEAEISEESVTTDGLGPKVKMVGKKTAPLLRLSVGFDSAWQAVNTVLRHEKITITDHDRQQGYYQVTFNLDAHAEDKGLLFDLGDKLFGDSFGLRKYQINLRRTEKHIYILASDLGAVTTEADAGVEEVVDSHSKGPEDSEWRLLSVLYKGLRDGYAEEEKASKGWFD